MGLCVERLYPIGGVSGVARAGKARGGVVFLRFVLEHQDDLPADVDVLVVIIAHPGGRDAIACKGQWGGKVNVVTKAAKHFGRLPVLFGRAETEGESIGRGIWAILDQRDRLKPARRAFRISCTRLQTGLGEFCRDPLNRGVIPRLERHTALQGIGCNKCKVGAQVCFADVIETRSLRGRHGRETNAIGMRCAGAGQQSECSSPCRATHNRSLSPRRSAR